MYPVFIDLNSCYFVLILLKIEFTKGHKKANKGNS